MATNAGVEVGSMVKLMKRDEIERRIWAVLDRPKTAQMVMEETGLSRIAVSRGLNRLFVEGWVFSSTVPVKGSAVFYGDRNQKEEAEALAFKTAGYLKLAHADRLAKRAKLMRAMGERLLHLGVLTPALRRMALEAEPVEPDGKNDSTVGF